MFRFLGFLLFLALIVILAAGAYLWLSRVQTLERFFSSTFHRHVMIDSVDVQWDKIIIKGMRIENPTNSTLPNAFEAETITIEAKPLDLVQERILIRNVAIENPTFSLELYNSSGTDNNWARILSNLPRSQEKQIAIEKLTFSNLHFSVLRANGKKISLPPLSSLEFEHLGQRKPLSFPQIAQVLFESLLHYLTAKPHLGNIMENVPTFSKEILDGVNTTIPVEEAKSHIRQGYETLKKKTQEATEYLQEFFSK